MIDIRTHGFEDNLSIDVTIIKNCVYVQDSYEDSLFNYSEIKYDFQQFVEIISSEFNIEKITFNYSTKEDILARMSILSRFTLDEVLSDKEDIREDGIRFVSISIECQSKPDFKYKKKSLVNKFKDFFN